MFHVYILHSPSLDRYYIGQTGDIGKRLDFHRNQSTPFTAKAQDWQLVFLEPVSSRQEAMALERRIKRAKSRRSIDRYVQDERNQIKAGKPIEAGSMSVFQGPPTAANSCHAGHAGNTAVDESDPAW